ncbi:MAG: hypothetical protein HY673_03990 [Chloroflexi bacterium]|nr:hypothetical protein [Chloroflexota bacterium]
MALTDNTTGGRSVMEIGPKVKITLAEAVKAGDPIGYSSGWKLALGDGTIPAQLFAIAAGASGDVIEAAPAALIGGLSGATAGDLAYLATAGGFSATAGTVVETLGAAVSATEIMVSVRQNLAGQIVAAAGKLFFRDSGLYVHSSADGKLKIAADGTGTDDITLSGTITLDDDMITPTDKKVQFRDTGLYINSGADGKLTISSDGAGADEITLAGTVTLTDDLITPTDKKIQFRDTGLYINSGADGKLTISSDGAGADDITLAGTVTVSDNITMADGKNIITNATTGTKIGTAASQKIGFWNADPVIQQAHIANTSGDDATAVNAILVVLETLGFTATS